MSSDYWAGSLEQVPSFATGTLDANRAAGTGATASTWIATELPTDCGPLLHRISYTLRGEAHTGSRPFHEIARMYVDHKIYFAMSSSIVLGWLLVVDHTPTLQEIAGAYVLPDFRRQGVLETLVAECINRRPSTLAVVTDESLALWARAQWGFRPCSIYTAVRLTRTRIVRDRIRLSRLRSLRGYIQRRHAFVLIRETGKGACPASTETPSASLPA